MSTLFWSQRNPWNFHYVVLSKLNKKLSKWQCLSAEWISLHHLDVVELKLLSFELCWWSFFCFIALNRWVDYSLQILIKQWKEEIWIRLHQGPVRHEVKQWCSSRKVATPLLRALLALAPWEARGKLLYLLPLLQPRIWFCSTACKRLGRKNTLDVCSCLQGSEKLRHI